MYQVKLVSIVKRLLTNERADVWCVCSGDAVIRQCASREEAEEIAYGNNLMIGAVERAESSHED